MRMLTLDAKKPSRLCWVLLSSTKAFLQLVCHKTVGAQPKWTGMLLLHNVHSKMWMLVTFGHRTPCRRSSLHSSKASTPASNSRMCSSRPYWSR